MDNGGTDHDSGVAIDRLGWRSRHLEPFCNGTLETCNVIA